MINKRLLIKNLLSHNDENSFFDKKVLVDLVSNEGKSKILKHISALSNSNPENNSYLIIGIDNDTNDIKGVDFLDDSKIQNLVKSYLTNPPIVRYENIYFPDLPKNKTIGLLTINPCEELTYFSKSISKITSGSAYYRQGSNSIQIEKDYAIDISNKKTVTELENFSKVSLKQLLDDLFDFYKIWGADYHPKYKVYKDQFVVCWSGYSNIFDNENYLSEVDIRILNEGSSFFYSAIKWVKLLITDNDFMVTEFVNLGFNDSYKLYPLETLTLSFEESGRYFFKCEIIFGPPRFKKNEIEKLYSESKELERKIIDGWKIETQEDLTLYEGLANYFLICYLNGIAQSKEDLINSEKYLDGAAAEWRSDCLRILEKYEIKTAVNTL